MKTLTTSNTFNNITKKALSQMNMINEDLTKPTVVGSLPKNIFNILKNKNNNNDPKNVVYGVVCPQCLPLTNNENPIIYIGETTRGLRSRYLNHMQEHNSPLYIHGNNFNHQICFHIFLNDFSRRIRICLAPFRFLHT